MSWTKRRFLGSALASVFALQAPARAQTATPVKIRAASLTLPVVNPVVVNVIKEQGMDRSHQLDLVIRPYPSISSFYAGLATGEVDTLIGGPIVLQKLRNEGATVKIVSTMMRLSDLVVLVRDPAIKTVADLKGKSLAADMGSQQYQVLALYAHDLGMDLRRDVTVMQANYALARGQLSARRVDAAMVIEPIATAMLKEDPQLRIIFNGDTAWKQVTGERGWELVAAVSESFIKASPGAVSRWIEALHDVAEFMHAQPDATDEIAHRTAKLEPGLMHEILSEKRWEFEVLPAWGAERAVMQDMIDRAAAAGFISQASDDGLFYAP